MKKIIKIIFYIIILVIIILGTVYYLNMPLSVETTTVSPKDVSMYFIEEGEAVSERVVDVYSVVSGEIEKLNVNEGAYINAGDIICTINSSALQFQINELQSGIRGYESQKNNLSIEESKEKDTLNTSKKDLEAQLKALKAQQETSNITKEEQLSLQNVINKQYYENLEFAEDNFKKIEVLYNNGALSKKDYDDAVKAVDDCKIAVSQGEKQLSVIENSDQAGSSDYYNAMEESINAQISGIDDRISKSYTSAMSDYYSSLIEGGNVSIGSLQNKIQDCTIKSPISGTITTLNIKDTNIVNAQIPVASITESSSNVVEVYVNTTDIDEVKIGQKVELILKRRNEDKILYGTVAKIDDKATIKLSALGIEEKKVKVTVAPDSAEDFKTGFDVDVKFIYYSEPEKLTVPKTAVFKVDDKDMVWVVKEGMAEMTEVTKGVELRTEYIITDGLTENDIVINEANEKKLKTGIKVSTNDETI